MVFEKIAAAPVAGAASSNSKVFASSATARVARRSSVVEGASGAGAPAKKFWTEVWASETEDGILCGGIAPRRHSSEAGTSADSAVAAVKSGLDEKPS